jgi:hypothetical protein
MPQQNVFIGDILTPGQQQDARLEREARALTLRAAVEQRNAQIAAQRQQQADQEWLKRAAQTYRHDNGRPDLDAIADAYIQMNPDAGMKFKSQVNADRKSMLDAERMRFEHDRDVAQISARMLKSAMPETYADIRKRLTLLDPESDAQLPPQFDPAALQQIAAMAEQFAGTTEDKSKALQMLVDGKLDDWAGWNLEHVNSQQELDEFYDDASAMMDAASLRMLKRTYGDTFTPEFAQNAAAVRATRKQQPERPPSAGSDYAQFLTRWAAEKHQTTPDKLTASQELAARRAYGQADDAARRPLAPIVIQTGQGPQMLDRSTGSTRPIFDAHGNVISQAPTAEMRNRGAVRDTATRSVDAIRALSEKVINKRGIAQRATAAGRSVESALGSDPEYRTYQDARMSLAGNLAVLQQGSRPSDADIKAIWLPLVPDVFRDTDQSAAMKWDLIYTLGGLTPPEQRGGGGPVRVKGRDGRTYEFPNQAAADAFKKAGGE